jgi:hypothetical protein
MTKQARERCPAAGTPGRLTTPDATGSTLTSCIISSVFASPRSPAASQTYVRNPLPLLVCGIRQRRSGIVWPRAAEQMAASAHDWRGAGAVSEER